MPTLQERFTKLKRTNAKLWWFIVIGTLGLIFIVTFLALGILKPESPLLTLVDEYLIHKLKYVLPVILPVFPLLWHFFFDEMVRNSLVEDLKNIETIISVQCPNPDCQYPFAKAIKKVKFQNKGVIHIECEKCGQKYDKNST